MNPVLIAPVSKLVLIVVLSSSVLTQSSGQTNRTIRTEADFDRAMEELSNWGRWGADDELGAANLITDEKRQQAVALVSEASLFPLLTT
jgi:hypothetical protein